MVPSGVTIYTVRGTQMVWWLGLDDSGSPITGKPHENHPIESVAFVVWPIPVSRVAVKPGENCLPTSYLCGVSLFCCLSNVCPFNSVCFQCCLCSPFRADSIAEKTLQDKETRKEALRKVWFDACRVEHFCWFVLVGGLEHSWIMTFHILRMSSSIFFRGVGIPPTSVCIDHHFIQTCMYIHNIT